MQVQTTIFYCCLPKYLEDFMNEVEKARKKVDEKMSIGKFYLNFLIIAPDENFSFKGYDAFRSLFACPPNVISSVPKAEEIVKYMEEQTKICKEIASLREELETETRPIFLFKNKLQSLGIKEEELLRSISEILLGDNYENASYKRDLKVLVAESKSKFKRLRKLKDKLAKISEESELLPRKEIEENLEKLDPFTIDSISLSLEQLGKAIQLARPYVHPFVSLEELVEGVDESFPQFMSQELKKSIYPERVMIEPASTYRLEEFFKGNPVERENNIKNSLKYLEFRIGALNEEISKILDDKEFKGVFKRYLGKNNYTLKSLLNVQPSDLMKKFEESKEIKNSLRLLKRLKELYRTKSTLENRKESFEKELESMRANGFEKELGPRIKLPKEASIGEFLIELSKAREVEKSPTVSTTLEIMREGLVYFLISQIDESKFKEIESGAAGI